MAEARRYKKRDSKKKVPKVEKARGPSSSKKHDYLNPFKVDLTVTVVGECSDDDIQVFCHVISSDDEKSFRQSAKMTNGKVAEFTRKIKTIKKISKTVCVEYFDGEFSQVESPRVILRSFPLFFRLIELVVFSIDDPLTFDSITELSNLAKVQENVSYYLVGIETTPLRMILASGGGLKKFLNSSQESINLTDLEIEGFEKVSKANAREKCREIGAVDYYHATYLNVNEYPKLFQEIVEEVLTNASGGKSPLKEAFASLSLQKYYHGFHDQGIILSDLECISEDELAKLIPDKFPRRRLQTWLECNRNPPPSPQNKDKGKRPTDSTFDYPEEEAKYRSKPWFLNRSAIALGRKIAKGSFGSVTKGVLRLGNLEFDVAVKEIVVANKTEIAGVLHEIDLMSQLKSKNVVKCFGAYFEHKTIAIVMEFCELDLKEYLQVLHGDRRKIQTIVSICKGLKYIHDKQIVYRDLKPENVLVKKGVIKLSDYGTSKHISSIKNTFCGTPEFMCPSYYDPSLLEGKSDFATKSKIDIYALGVLMWEVMVGETPFEDVHAENPVMKIVTIHQNQLRPSLSRVVCVGLRHIIQDCWQQELKRRPNVQKVISDLKELLKSDEI